MYKPGQLITIDRVVYRIKYSSPGCFNCDYAGISILEFPCRKCMTIKTKCPRVRLTRLAKPCTNQVGKFRIKVYRIGCMDCHSVKNDIHEDPYVTCAKICRKMCNSNIKLVKVFEGDLDNFLKYHNEHSDL